MKYEKPKIEIIRIYNQEDVASLTDGGNLTNGTAGTSSTTKVWSNFYSFGDA